MLVLTMPVAFTISRAMIVVIASTSAVTASVMVITVMFISVFFPVVAVITSAVVSMLVVSTVPRHVHLVVPTVLHKIHRAVTCVVSIAEFRPVFCMTWRYA